VLLAGLGIAALAVDVPLAAWVNDGGSPSLLNKLCGLSEAMGHGVGVLLIALAILVLDPSNRHRIPRILVAALGSGLLANVFKLALARTRPNHFDFDLQSALESFGPWFPMLGNPSWNQGFPSSHAATAAGLAIVLSFIYPRGRLLFAGLAVLAGLQRVLEEAHFASDVLWGAAIGCAFAPLCVYGGGLARVLDRLEARLTVEGSSQPDRVAPADPIGAGHDVRRAPHERPRAA
jgi:membrane-associated phospholipid phosphatase